MWMQSGGEGWDRFDVSENEEDGDATAVITGEFAGGKRIPVGTWLGFILCLIRFNKKGRITINDNNRVSQWSSL